MKPKFRVILERALEEGIRCGYRRAFKHIEKTLSAPQCAHR